MTIIRSAKINPRRTIVIEPRPEAVVWLVIMLDWDILVGGGY